MKRDDAQRKAIEKGRLIDTVFSSPEGKRVLELLDQEFGHSTLKKDATGRVDPNASIAAAGSREVLIYINDMRKKANAPA